MLHNAYITRINDCSLKLFLVQSIHELSITTYSRGNNTRIIHYFNFQAPERIRDDVQDDRAHNLIRVGYFIIYNINVVVRLVQRAAA